MAQQQEMLLDEIQNKRDETNNEKRKYNELECESDEDEDFAGFDEATNGISSPPNVTKRVRESTPESSTKQIISPPIDESNALDASLKKVIKTLTNPLDEIFKKPFEFGWKRELVYRAVPENKTKEKGEVYYITPAGKKIRTRNDILANLHDGLTIDNFTFVKDPVGAGPEDEIIRSARMIIRKSTTAEPPVEPTVVLGKRVPKPKMPKGASPPPILTRPSINLAKTPPSRSNSQVSPRSSSIFKNNVKPFEKTIPVDTDSKILTGKVAKIKNKGSPGAIVEDSKKTSKSNSNSRIASPQPAHITENLDNTAVSLATISSNNIGYSNEENKRKSTNIDQNRNFAANFFCNVSIGYEVLFQTFQYLKVQELLRASCVCRMWNQIANHQRLWRTVRMKNSHVNDWLGLANTLKNNGTKHLDLRKMLISSNSEEMWQSFSEHIATVSNLERIDLCRCSSFVVENLVKSNHNLKVLNALTIKTDLISVNNFENMTNLEELRLKSSNGLAIEDNISSLSSLIHLRHLSLTTITKFGSKSLNFLASLESLESLELGECTELNQTFAEEVLPNMKSLQRLRLEKGQEEFAMFEILDSISKLEKLHQLELINCDVKVGFDEHISKCTNIKKFLLIPTYVSQSAATNHMVLSGVSKLEKSLQVFIWTVTVELLRVTELYIDQCDKNNRDDKNTPGESIPILKPVPGDEEAPIPDLTSSSDTPAQVEIVPLVRVQNILYKSLSTTKIKILKIPFLGTWKQNMIDLP